jgi:hypothetical protein
MLEVVAGQSKLVERQAALVVLAVVERAVQT